MAKHEEESSQSKLRKSKRKSFDFERPRGRLKKWRTNVVDGGRLVQRMYWDSHGQLWMLTRTKTFARAGVKESTTSSWTRL